jgi:CRISPR system Cascade subunit CasD
VQWTLLIRLAGPQQAWGTQSRFTHRDSGREPSKSGVIGLLCAALGKPREENDSQAYPTLAQLAVLRMGVRVLREGVVMRDYHTAGGGKWLGKRYGVYKFDGSPPDTVVSERYYLADADFLVGLESETSALLQRLDNALAHPQWQIFLGRKSFVPSWPLRLPADGLKNQPLEEALRTYQTAHKHGRSRLVIETREVSNEVRLDVPLSFSPREFALRYVHTEFFPDLREEA